MQFRPSIRKGTTALIALLMGLAIVLPRIACAETDERQYKVEAAFLYNFFNYITWPGYASPQALQQPAICLYGDDPVEPYLEYIQQKKSGEKQIRIRNLKEGDSTADCQMLFLHNPSAAEVQALAAQHVLVVSESDEDGTTNGMIELFRDDERLRMRINQPLLEKNNFQVSSRLLNIAEVVK